MLWKRLLEPLQRRAEQACVERQRLNDARDEYDRLRAELSHLEHEIYAIWESDLPRSRKALLESVLRVRAQRVEARMEILAYALWCGRPPEVG